MRTDADRAYDKLRYEQFQIRRQAVIAAFGGECFVCGDADNLHLHHEQYVAGESDYPRHARSMSARLKRVEEAEKHPERFRLLCATCHGLVHAVEEGDITEADAVKQIQERIEHGD